MGNKNSNVKVNEEIPIELTDENTFDESQMDFKLKEYLKRERHQKNIKNVLEKNVWNKIEDNCNSETIIILKEIISSNPNDSKENNMFNLMLAQIYLKYNLCFYALYELYKYNVQYKNWKYIYDDNDIINAMLKHNIINFRIFLEFINRKYNEDFDLLSSYNNFPDLLNSLMINKDLQILEDLILNGGSIYIDTNLVQNAIRSKNLKYLKFILSYKHEPFIEESNKNIINQVLATTLMTNNLEIIKYIIENHIKPEKLDIETLKMYNAFNRYDDVKEYINKLIEKYKK